MEIVIDASEIVCAKACDCSDDKVSALPRMEEIGLGDCKQEEEEEGGTQPHTLEAVRWQVVIEQGQEEYHRRRSTC